MVKASERACNKAQALSEVPAEYIITPLGKARIRNKPKGRFTSSGDLWVLLESDDFPVDPDGYYFVNPPLKRGDGVEDPSEALREMVTDAATYYATHPEVWGRTTTTVFSSTADGRIISNHGTYATARSGINFSVNTTAAGGGENLIGQHLLTNYICYETFVDFDTSSIPDADTIDGAVLSIDGQFNGSITDFTIEARLHDWGGTLTSADWIPGASLSGKTLLASMSTSGFATSAYNDLTSEAAFVSNVSKTGVTSIVLCSSKTTAGTAPTGEERVAIILADEAGTTRDPKLVVNHTGASAGRPPGGLLRMGVG